MKSVIHTEDLTKVYQKGKIVALDKLTIDLPKDVCGIIGPNGSGKTTFIKIIVGLLRSFKGKISVLGFNIRENNELLMAKKQIGYAGEDMVFPRELRIEKLLYHIAKIKGLRNHASQEVDEVVELMNLHSYKKRRISELSAGMYQRVAIATALIGDPYFIILDEPFKSLDQDGRIILRELIKRKQKDHAFLISSHDLLELQEVVNHISLFRFGKLIYNGDLHSLLLTTKKVVIKVKISQDTEVENILKNNYPDIKIEKTNSVYRIIAELNNKELNNIISVLTNKIKGEIIYIERENLLERYKEIYRREEEN